MNPTVRHRAIPLLAIALACALGLSACDMKGDTMDAAGITLAEAKQLTLEQQFVQYGERYAEMQHLLLELQLQLTGPDHPWDWISAGIAPSGGGSSPDPLRGSTSKNSYFLDMRRTTTPPGAVGAGSELAPVLEFVKQRGWQVRTFDNTGHGWGLRAETDNGTHVLFDVMPDGRCVITLFSPIYWGQAEELLFAIVYRIPKEHLGTETSLPGEFTAFPQWSDPMRRIPSITERR